MTNEEQFERLLHAKHPCISIVTVEEDYALRLVRRAAMNTGRPLRAWSATMGVYDGLLPDAAANKSTCDPTTALIGMAGLNDNSICVTLDLATHLQNNLTLRALRALLSALEESPQQLVMIDHDGCLPEVIRAYAAPFEIALPDEAEIEQIVRTVLRGVHRDRPIEVDIGRTNWQCVLRNLRGLTRRQIRRIVQECVADDRRFDDADVNHVLASKRRMLSGSGLLEYVETPVTLDEIGGLSNLKQWLARRQDAVTDTAREYGLTSPRGVLMLGVQGAGKSLCAKAIATAWNQPLLRMDVGALYDRYVGESERRLRDSLHQAESMAPAILWIDEIEKAFASAASQSSDGGLSKRMFGQLLTWMQEHDPGLFLVATANDIEALPPELLRKGRFDEIFFVDLPSNEAREQILRIHLRKRGRDADDFDLAQLVALSAGFSGAEIEQAIIAALHDAFAENKKLKTRHVAHALQTSPPLSVTMAERVADLRAWAQGRCVPAE